MNGGMPLAWLHIKAILKGQRLLPLTALCIYTIKEELFLYLCGEKVKRRLHRSINYQRSEISGDPMIGSPPQSWFPNVLRAVSFAGLARRQHARSDKADRSEEHTSELQSLMRISYAVFCLKKKNTTLYLLLYCSF